MKRIAFVAIAAWTLTASSSAAQTRWQDQYAAYDEAMEVGDAAAAETSAREAWLITRQTMQDGETRALLAHNYAELVVASDPAAAEDVLLDALALGQRGFGNDNLAPLTLQFMLAEARSAAEPKNRNLATGAVEAARTLPLGQEVLNPIITQRIRLALTLRELRMFLQMGEVGGDLSDDFAETQGVPAEMALQAETLRAVALLSNQPNDPNFRQYRAQEQLRRARYRGYGARLERSYARFHMIASSFGPQPSIDDYDPTLAAAVAWRGLMFSFMGSYDTEHTDISAGLPPLPAVGSAQTCSTPIPWTKRPMEYPSESYGTNGAVLIGYHLTPEGKVEGARVLGEIPAARFGAQVLRYVRRWEADVPPGTEPFCLRDRLSTAFFSSRL